jgi:hypothetical protein
MLTPTGEFALGLTLVFFAGFVTYCFFLDL